MIKILRRFLGDKATRDLKTINPIIKQIHEAYENISGLSNNELRAKTDEFKARIAQNIIEEKKEIESLNEKINNDPDITINQKEELYKNIDKLNIRIYEKTEEELKRILPEAFSVIKETAKRFSENEVVEVTANERDGELAAVMENVNISDGKAYYDNSWMAGGNKIIWDMVHYDVQLIGGVILHEGKIAEMATGEGKTLVATLPVYLNALSGKGVHIVTVNDYLAKRDSEWMGMLYMFHGLKVDCIDKHQPNSTERRQAYLADITFGTNNEFGFDYLRDNMTGNPNELVQRAHNYVIVDEVDSVLIDDARTPLIISGPTPKGDNQEFDALKTDVQKLYNAQKNLVSSLLSEAKSILKERKSNDDVKKGKCQRIRL